MGTRIKLQNISFAKVKNDAGHLFKDVVKFVGNRKEKFLGAGLLLVVADNIRVRFARRKDQKAFEECAIKQQKIVRKHEGEIKVLREEAEQAYEANKRIGQLEQIVKNIIAGGGSE